jgi:hypothetical protein
MAALLNGTLTINGAMPFCKLPMAEQLELFIRHIEGREINKVIRRSIAQPRQEKTTASVATLLDALRQQEARGPGIGCSAGRSVSTHGNSSRSGSVTRTVFSKGAKPT